jgi:acyl carrier protein
MPVMEGKEMEEEIRSYIVEHFAGGGRAVGADDLLFESGIIDSMGFIILLSFLEKTFGVSFPMSEITIENFNTVRKIANAVRRKKGGKKR